MGSNTVFRASTEAKIKWLLLKHQTSAKLGMHAGNCDGENSNYEIAINLNISN